MAGKSIGVGIIGAGDISRQYVDCLRAFERFSLKGIARHQGAAGTEIHGVPCFTTDGLLKNEEIDLVLNLTPPLQHAAITADALRTGKHVYSEKPLAHDLAQADALLALASSSKRLLSCAPATHLGPGQQTVRHMIDLGELGEVVGANATVVYAGPDRWHHHPAALFGPAAGPLFDLGVYFVSAFVHWFGPVRRVSAAGRQMQAQRQIHAGPLRGESFAVKALTHVSGWIEFDSGVIATLTTSFDSPGSRASAMEVQGTRASVALESGTDGFKPTIRRCERFDEWEVVEPRITGWTDRWWAAGPVDAADALLADRTPRTSSAIARHVLEVLIALEKSCQHGTTVSVEHRCTRAPALLPGAIDLNFPHFLQATPIPPQGAQA